MAEVHRAKDEEVKKISCLLKECSRHAQVEVLREYVSKKKSAVSDIDDNWVGWAEAVADMIDPLVECDDSILEYMQENHQPERVEYRFIKSEYPHWSLNRKG